jgi:hypothetical protein
VTLALDGTEFFIEGAAHSSPTNAVRARWIALSGLVLSERHGSQGDALGFRSPPGWGFSLPDHFGRTWKSQPEAQSFRAERSAVAESIPDHQTPTRGALQSFRAERSAVAESTKPARNAGPGRRTNPDAAPVVRRVNGDPGNQALSGRVTQRPANRRFAGRRAFERLKLARSPGRLKAFVFPAVVRFTLAGPPWNLLRMPTFSPSIPRAIRRR